ncbi:MAG TPA: DUF1573 domain-containing protein, partial [Puia sp.]
MKKLAIVIGLFSTVLAARAQAVNTGGTAMTRPADVIQPKESIHNFGKIPQGRPATYTFEIVNTGATPILLDNVQASCGCTTPEWSREAIPAGATSRIKVGYNAYAEGPFNKTVTVIYNSNQTKT